jgi:signal transduction histidine kinase
MDTFKVWQKLQNRFIQPLARWWQPPTESAEYVAWRNQFLLDRLQIALWIAFPVIVAHTANTFIVLFWQSQEFERDLLKLYEDATLMMRLRTTTIVNLGALFALLFICLILRKSRWGRQHPTVIFLFLSLSLNLIDLIVGTFFGIPAQPDSYLFLAQAVLIPVCWRLHLISQLATIGYYAIIYPLLGLTKIGNRALYNTYSLQLVITLCWIAVICILSVYLYERLKRSEFESRRQLCSVINALSHDLKNPVMGTSLVLQGLLSQPDPKLSIDRRVLEQLLAGSERQLNLINSLLEAQSAEVGTMILHRQPLHLKNTVDRVVNDLDAIVRLHHMTVVNLVDANLPAIDADKTQLWRVFNNLISNALTHNPRGTKIEIVAEVTGDRSQWIRCSVRDNGIGISPAQLPHLFELYTRGKKARRMPGLGLGLYLCQQIVTAHGGEIGVTSQPGNGSNFWFTLPVAESLNSEI